MSEQFPPPVTPSELIIEEARPATREFLRRHVDMQVADLRLLFRLPADDLDPDVGCNLTVAAMMLNVISGFSVWFFHTDEAIEIRTREQQSGRRHSRKRFLGFVEEYWPQIEPEPEPGVVAERLYDIRNSLAHSLGVSDEANDPDPSRVRLRKRAYTPEEIVEQFERNLVHPLTEPVIKGAHAEYTVHLAGVYWALHFMLKAALRDRPQEIENAVAAITLPEVEELTD